MFIVCVYAVSRLCLFIIHKKCYEIKYKIGNAENLNIILLVWKLWKQAHLYEPGS